MFGEAFVLSVRVAEAGQHFQPRGEFIGQLAEVGASPFAFQELIASGQRLLQQRRHLARELSRLRLGRPPAVRARGGAHEPRIVDASLG